MQRRLGDVVQYAQHRRVQRVVVLLDQGVVAVGGEEGLDQVVGAEGEEVDLAGELLGHLHGGRHLDHHPDGDRLGEEDAVLEQVLAGLGDDLAAGAHLLEPGDHREEELDRTVHPGHEDRVITSYSIHYTKLYEAAVLVSR